MQENDQKVEPNLTNGIQKHILALPVSDTRPDKVPSLVRLW